MFIPTISFSPFFPLIEKKLRERRERRNLNYLFHYTVPKSYLAETDILCIMDSIDEHFSELSRFRYFVL